MTASTTRQVHLVRRPSGLPDADDFRVVGVPLPAPAEGEVLVRNTHLSVDPYMRGRMNDVESYAEPYALDAPLSGGAVGVVEQSRSDRVPEGSTVSHMAGWREAAVLPGSEVRVVDADLATAYLGVLGMPGLTAYVGLRRIAALAEGETVVVSGAAGAVGSTAGQLARLMGATRVIGSAGSPEKVAWLTDELGFDAAFDYHDGKVSHLLRDALERTGGGRADVLFDNVGGEHLEAGLLHLADFGRVAACGAITGYNDERPAPGPRTIGLVVPRRLTVRGFIVSDHADLAGEFYRQAPGWVAEGALRTRETYVDGLDRAPEAFLGLFSGVNLGKMLVRL